MSKTRTSSIGLLQFLQCSIGESHTILHFVDTFYILSFFLAHMLGDELGHLKRTVSLSAAWIGVLTVYSLYSSFAKQASQRFVTHDLNTD